MLAAFVLAACSEEKDTKIKSITAPGYEPRVYVLDTLVNGHIMMHDAYSREYGTIEYPECPKCKENLKKAITEVIDSLVRVNDESIIQKLQMESPANPVNYVYIYD